MALERSADEYGHVCALPWPADPELPQGHVCECSRRWLYQPARWEPLYSLEELHLKQASGAFLRGIVRTFATEEPADRPATSAIVSIR
jgi:hypothetical protein